MALSVSLCASLCNRKMRSSDLVSSHLGNAAQQQLQLLDQSRQLSSMVWTMPFIKLCPHPMLSIFKLCAVSPCFKPYPVWLVPPDHTFSENFPSRPNTRNRRFTFLHAGVSKSVKLADILNSLCFDRIDKQDTPFRHNCYFCRDTPSQICWYCLWCCANHKVGFWGFLVKIFPKVEFWPQSFYNHSWWKRDHGGVIDNLPWLTIAIGQWPTSMVVYKKQQKNII